MSLVSLMESKGIQHMHPVGFDCPVHGPVTVLQYQLDGESVHSTCPKCSEERIRREELENTERRAIVRKRASDPEYQICKRLEAMGVQEENIPNRFSNFNAYTPTLEEAASYAKEIAIGYHRFLVMVGSTGVGKTHLAVSAMVFAAAQGRSMMYTKESQLFREIHATYNRKTGPTEKDVYNQYVCADLLVIDELSSKPLADHDLIVMEDLIDDRNTSRKATILISNATQDEYTAHVSDKMRSRIARTGATFCISEVDWRRRHAAGNRE